MTRRIILVDIGAGLTLRGLLPSVTLFGTYSAALKAAGGQPPYTYTVSAGALPVGLYLDSATGIISGTASAAGVAAFTVRATDISGAFVDRAFAISVIAEPLTLAGDAPNGTTGTAYAYAYTTAGGVPPYSYAIVAGALPAGVTLNASTGALSGTPTSGGALGWTVRVTDAVGTTFDLADSASFAYTTLALAGAYAAATVGTTYSSDLTISGGNGVYSNPRVTVGTLPAGLALSIVDGKLRLSGTPTAAATSNFTVAVDSGDGQTATSDQSVAVTTSTVSSLLHFDGNNGDLVFVDEKDNTWTPYGSTVALSTTQRKFGNTSALFSGSGHLNMGLSEAFDFGTAPFAIAMWLFPLTLPSVATPISKWASNSNASFRLLILNTGVIRFDYLEGGAVASVASAAGVITAGSFQHVEVDYDGATFRLFVNGIVCASRAYTGGITASPTAPVVLGMNFDQSTWFYNGYMDEFLAVKGNALHTSNFTPPTSPYLP